MAPVLKFADVAKLLVTNRFFAMVLLLSSTPSNVVATEFTVEFDIGPVGGANGNVVSQHLAASNWTTVGNRRGSNLSNLTRDTIVAIWMKVPRGSHTFADNVVGGDAFKTVWRKKDGSEVLFLGGAIPSGSVFWNRVLPRYLDNSNPLRGQAFHDGGNIPTPNESDWDLLSGGKKKTTSKPEFALKRLANRRVRNIPEIRSYAMIAGQPIIAFLSTDGFTFAYDSRTDQLHPLEVNAMCSSDVDHIRAAVDEAGRLTAQLFRTGTEVATGTCQTLPLKLPSKKSRQTAKTISRVYFSGPNVFDLETGKFMFTLFDVPSALAIRVNGTFIREDKVWYYFKSEGYSQTNEIEWRFTIKPARAFQGHRVQKKTATDADYRDLGYPVYMTFPRVPQ